MSETKGSVALKAYRLFSEGIPVWDIARRLDLSEAQVVALLGLE